MARHPDAFSDVRRPSSHPSLFNLVREWPCARPELRLDWQPRVAVSPFAWPFCCVLLTAASSARQSLPLEPPKDAGMGITPAFEGWYPNEDGTFTLLIGYFNRNAKQTLDIPIGPNNRIEPGGPDMGQPTYFGVRRNWGVFAITVPKDFGSTKRLHVDDRRQRQNRVDPGWVDQGLPNRAVQGRGDGQPAAEAQVRRERSSCSLVRRVASPRPIPRRSDSR